MGLISLLVFFIQSLVGFSGLQSYNIVLLLILFMAFCFFADAIFLVSLCHKTVNKLIQDLRTPESELLNQYKAEFLDIVDSGQSKYQNAINLVTRLNILQTQNC